MRVRKEIERHILDSWNDKQVARWVLNRLPLLEKGFTCKEVPVFRYSIKEGLTSKNGLLSTESFKERHKLVISGGFEGTQGHLRAVENMHETKWLTGRKESLVVLMLEPDSFIHSRKKRRPLTILSQREALWKTSGLVDAVVILPDSSKVENKSYFYTQIAKHLGNAEWCASIENPAWREVVTKQGLQEHLDSSRIYDDELYVHSSFLESTRALKASELKRMFFKDVLQRVYKTELPEMLRIIPAEELTNIIVGENFLDFEG